METPIRNQDNVIRAFEKTMNPAKLISYLPVASPFTTATLTAGVWTKILAITTAKELHEFAVADIGGGDMRYQFQGVITKPFNLNMTSSAKASVNSTVIEFAMSKGQGATVDDLEPGVYAECISKLTTEVASLPCVGHFHAEPNDYIAIWLKVSNTSTVTLSGLSILVMETN